MTEATPRSRPSPAGVKRQVKSKLPELWRAFEAALRKHKIEATLHHVELHVASAPGDTVARAAKGTRTAALAAPMEAAADNGGCVVVCHFDKDGHKVCEQLCH